MIQNQEQADREFEQLLALLGVQTMDGTAIHDAAAARGFTGASLFAVMLATAAFMEMRMPLEKAVTSAVELLARGMNRP